MERGYTGSGSVTLPSRMPQQQDQHQPPRDFGLSEIPDTLADRLHAVVKVLAECDALATQINDALTGPVPMGTSKDDGLVPSVMNVAGHLLDMANRLHEQLRVARNQIA